MAFRRPYTQREMDFIRDNWKTSTTAEIAKELGRSPSGIYKKINDMRLRAPHRGGTSRPMESGVEKAPPMDSTDARSTVPFHRGPETTKERLCGLRDLIWRSLLDASPQDVARLAPEYRKTIEAIEAAGEVGSHDDAGCNGDGDLADILSLVRTT